MRIATARMKIQMKKVTKTKTVWVKMNFTATISIDIGLEATMTSKVSSSSSWQIEIIVMDATILQGTCSIAKATGFEMSAWQIVCANVPHNPSQMNCTATMQMVIKWTASLTKMAFSWLWRDNEALEAAVTRRAF